MNFRPGAFALLLVSFGFLSGQVHAETLWKATQIDASPYPDNIVTDTRQLAGKGLVDGRVATLEGGDIVAAWYSKPTKRYRHAILGDGVEAGQLNVRTAGNREYSLRLPRIEVFEDQTPRLADLDGDGTVEVVTIRSSLAAGASVTIYGLRGRKLVRKASTGFYGRPNRWLNVAGIAAFLGTDHKEIAFVETPHIGGNLFFYRYSDGALTKLSAASDFSNHETGSREMRLSALADVNGDGQVDLALPSADRRSLRIMGFKGRNLRALAIARLPAAIDKAIAVSDGDDRGFIVGLENGAVYRVHP